MEDIIINTPRLKFEYWLSWFGFIVIGMLWAWITAYVLSMVGKTTSANVKRKKGVLNKTWQKFVFMYGTVMGYVFILILIFGLIFG
jgi:uncharacterized membrane protein